MLLRRGTKLCFQHEIPRGALPTEGGLPKHRQRLSQTFLLSREKASNVDFTMAMDSQAAASIISETVAAASTATPTPEAAAKSTQSQDVVTEIAPPYAADDEALIERLVSIINQVYLETEGDMWNEGFLRTNPEAIRVFIRAGELGVAYIQDTPRGSSVSKGRPVGCFHLRPSPDATAADFGMFALDPVHRGTGLGRQMLAFAEEHCRAAGRRVMRLEVLFPTDSEHTFKARLSAWYTRAGYELVKLAVFQDGYPELAPLLRRPCDYRVFEKRLV